MGQALYRSYRSQKLSEIIGQEHITTALSHALTNGTLCHAYLFTGPRGVGKTSIARILAYEINGLPYQSDRPHLDIIEIDAASNRRIDEIRDLRDKVHSAPSSAKYKVYIIDEVHMLTKEAFNALLKTLEEPPAHVVFILATTEAHKLPETIVSRTQRYAFKPVELPKVVAHLRHIAEKESIDISDEALQLIAEHGEGSFRDSISLLDQVRNQPSTVSLADVQAMLGIAPEAFISQLLAGLANHDGLAVAQSLRAMQDQGYEPAAIAKQIAGSVRSALIAGQGSLAHGTAVTLLANLVQVPASPDPRASLEIALLDTALAGQPVAPVMPLATPTTPVGGKPAAPAIKAAAKPPAKVIPEETVATPAIEVKPQRATPKRAVAGPAITQETTSTESDAVLDDNDWHTVLTELKKHHNTLYGIVRSAHTTYQPGRVTLEVSSSFFQKRLHESRHKQLLLDTIRSTTGHGIQFDCIIGQGKPAPADAPDLPPADGEVVHRAQAAAPTQLPPGANPLETISNIFGGAEVLES